MHTHPIEYHKMWKSYRVILLINLQQETGVKKKNEMSKEILSPSHT